MDTLFKYNDFEHEIDISDYEFNELVQKKASEYQKNCTLPGNEYEVVAEAMHGFISDVFGKENIGKILKNPKSAIQCLDFMVAFNDFVVRQRELLSDKSKKIIAAKNKYKLHPVSKK